MTDSTATQPADLRAILTEHFLFALNCDHDAKTDTPWCGCAKVDLGTHPTVGEAVQAWVGHVLAVLTAAGWPNTHQPNPDVTAARAARQQLDEARKQVTDVQNTRLRNLREIGRALGCNQYDTAGQIADAAKRIVAERDEARAALDRIAGYHGGPDGLAPDLIADLAGSRTMELVDALDRAKTAKRERDEARRDLAAAQDRLDANGVIPDRYDAAVAERDEARRELADLKLAMEGTSAQPYLTLTRECNAERERADSLARDIVRKTAHASAALTVLRAGIEALKAHATQERAGWDATAGHPNSVPAAVLTDIIDRLRALLDGPTPAPSTTQPADVEQGGTLGWEVLTQEPDGTWLANWDGETHATREDAQVGAADAAQAGYWARVARLVSDGPVLALDVPPDMPAGPPSSPTTDCSTCGGNGVVRCLAHIAGDGCEGMQHPCLDCATTPASPTTDQPAPGQGQDTTGTQEGAQTCRRCGAPITRDDWRWIGPDRRSSCADGPLRGELHTPTTETGADRG